MGEESGGATQVDLSGVTTQLTRIADSLEELLKIMKFSESSFIVDKASDIFCNNECPVGQEQIKIKQSIDKANTLFTTLKNKKYIED